MAEDGLVKIICSLCERMILFGLGKVKADGADFDAALRRGAGRGGTARAFARGLAEKDGTDARSMSRYCRLVPLARERADERYPIRSRRCRLTARAMPPADRLPDPRQRPLRGPAGIRACVRFRGRRDGAGHRAARARFRRARARLRLRGPARRGSRAEPAGDRGGLSAALRSGPPGRHESPYDARARAARRWFGTYRLTRSILPIGGQRAAKPP
ncbi:hypothetical protein BGLA2_590009 [Burkholderia gladioli]|nr:hypothetical protein BGLA2_590009 [Burkholderia gladioli]